MVLETCNNHSNSWTLFKMKTETQIADENITFLIARERNKLSTMVCEEHKASCQRFLEFLEAIRFTSAYKGTTKYIKDVIDEKCEDLKQAIKLYEDVGI